MLLLRSSPCRDCHKKVQTMRPRRRKHAAVAPPARPSVLALVHAYAGSKSDLAFGNFSVPSYLATCLHLYIFQSFKVLYSPVQQKAN